MKIAFLLHTFPGIGGTETVTIALAEWFTKQGVECYVIAWHQGINSFLPDYIKNILYLPDNQDIDSENNNMVICRFVDIHGVSIIINQGPFWSAGLNRQIYANIKIISVLHYAPSFRIDHSKYIIRKLFHTKDINILDKIKATIRYVLCDWFSHMDFNRVDRPLLKNIVNNSDAFVLLCDAYILQMQNLLLLPDKSKLYAIPNPITIGDNIPKGMLGQKTESQTLLFVGRLTAWDKRVDRLLRIWNKIQTDYPDWKMFIVGDGEEKDNLENLSKILGLERVYFKGFCDPSPYYKQASILCSTSSSEGFPMIFCEAALHGVSIVTYNVSAGVEYLINTLQNGILIPSFDEKKYIESLILLMNDSSKREKLAENGIQNLSKLNIETIGLNWLSLFDRILLK